MSLGCAFAVDKTQSLWTAREEVSLPEVLEVKDLVPSSFDACVTLESFLCAARRKESERDCTARSPTLTHTHSHVIPSMISFSSSKTVLKSVIYILCQLLYPVTTLSSTPQTLDGPDDASK
jgi:hypothetical protein